MTFNVLVVDDDFINRKLINAFLKKHANIIENITEAENGSEALDILASKPNINLVLLDIVMPVMGGEEFLEVFRADSKNRSIPVIVLSTDDTKKATVFELGADAFLQKPIREKSLIECIMEWVV